jgi:glucokinase
MNFLACDLGGTKVLLGIFKKAKDAYSPNLILKKNIYLLNGIHLNLF